MKHTLICLVENKPGVLNRVVSLFRRRNFNMDSLTVGRTHNPELSRITIVMEGQPGDAKLVTMNLYKLVDVIEVQDATNIPTIDRDLALIKVRTPDAYTKNGVTDLAYASGARLVDIGPEVTIVEISGSVESVEAFVEELRPFGIVEMVRTGLVSMGRGIRTMESRDYKSTRFPAKPIGAPETVPMNGNGNGRRDAVKEPAE
jgi:acetolactate synthase-1/3 small subunit